MELDVLSQFGTEEVVSRKITSIKEIQDTMNSLDWSKFHFVQLSKSKFDWIVVSGNLNEDGLSCFYEKNYEQFVIAEPPISVNQMTEILVSYFQDDGKYKNENKFFNESGGQENKEKAERKYREWKEEYSIILRKEKIRRSKRFVISIAIVVSILFSCYYWYTDELQFFGQKTEFAKAEIIDTKMHHLGRGYYTQLLTYEFDYNGETYTGIFEAGIRIGEQKVGNSVKVKFSTSNANRSKLIGIYKQN